MKIKEKTVNKLKHGIYLIWQELTKKSSFKILHKHFNKKFIYN